MSNLKLFKKMLLEFENMILMLFLGYFMLFLNGSFCDDGVLYRIFNVILFLIISLMVISLIFIKINKINKEWKW